MQLCGRLLELLQQRHEAGTLLLVVLVRTKRPASVGPRRTHVAISSQACFASVAHRMPSSVCSSSQAVASRQKACSSSRRRRCADVSSVRGTRKASWGSRGASRGGAASEPRGEPRGELLLLRAVFSASLANGDAVGRGVAGPFFGMPKVALLGREQILHIWGSSPP